MQWIAIAGSVCSLKACGFVIAVVAGPPIPAA